MVEWMIIGGLLGLLSFCGGETAKKEKEVWNNGFCPKCGKKWHWHFFHTGKRKAIAIDCQQCRIHHELTIYDPISGNG